MNTKDYPRDMVGYGKNPPDPQWPNGARIALQIILAYEEGAERCVLNGDPTSEFFINDKRASAPLIGIRDINVESMYEYGSRVGFWRLMRLLEKKGVNVTVLACGPALELNPDAATAMVEAGHEVASHGYRWIDYQFVGEDTEREHIRKDVETIERMTGKRPVGMYTGRISPQTLKLTVEEGGFIYDSDCYADDLPYWVNVNGKNHLRIPYTLEGNDMLYVHPAGFSCGDEYFTYLKDSFDVLYSEGADSPKILNTGLHCRISGRPGRFAAYERFLDYVLNHDKVWIAKREDIARHWMKVHPAEKSRVWDLYTRAIP